MKSFSSTIKRAFPFIYAYRLVFALWIIPFALYTSYLTFSTFVLAAVFFVLLRINYALDKNVLSASTLLISAWSVSLLMSSLSVKFKRGYLDFFNDQINLSTYVLVIGSIVLFMVGFFLFKKRRFTTNVYSNQLPIDRIIDFKRLKVVVRAFFLIGYAVFAYAVATKGVIPIFSSNINADRADFLPPFFGNLIILLQINVLLCGLFIVKYGFKRSREQLLLMALSFFALLSTSQRISSLESGLMLVVFVALLQSYTDLRVPKRIVRRLYVLVPLFAIAFLAIGGLRVGYTSSYDATWRAGLTDLNNFALEHIYIYLGGPALDNFQHLVSGRYVDSLDPKGGLLLFRGILHWFVPPGNLEVGYILVGPNNGTALFHYHADFGVAGVLGIPFFWGALFGILTTKFYSVFNIKTLVILCVLIASLLFAPLTERLSEHSTFIKLVIFYFTFSFLTRGSFSVRR